MVGKLKDHGQVTKHRTNDEVYLSKDRGLEGPYLVASIDKSSNPPKYTLCTRNGKPVEDNTKYEESKLSRA